MKLPMLSVILILAVSSYAAASPAVTKSYSYTDQEFASRDAACVSAMLEKITPSFEGLQKISLGTNSIVQTQSGYLAVYPGAKFEGRYGAAEGSLTCIFTPDGRNVSDVAVTFVGRGLAGFTGYPLAQTTGDPAQQRSTGMSSSIMIK